MLSYLNFDKLHTKYEFVSYGCEILKQFLLKLEFVDIL